MATRVGKLGGIGEVFQPFHVGDVVKFGDGSTGTVIAIRISSSFPYLVTRTGLVLTAEGEKVVTRDIWVAADSMVLVSVPTSSSTVFGGEEVGDTPAAVIDEASGDMTAAIAEPKTDSMFGGQNTKIALAVGAIAIGALVLAKQSK
jgi:hypothetical protein